MDQFGVRLADLTAHAGQVEAIADEVLTAKQAGDVVGADSGAYGQLCVMVPIMLGALQQVLVDAIGAAGDGLRDTSARLRTAAQHYEATDLNAAANLDVIKGAL